MGLQSNLRKMVNELTVVWDDSMEGSYDWSSAVGKACYVDPRLVL